MAFGYFMNMEKLTLDISEKHISFMTNDNHEDDCFLDVNKLTNNIENGFVVITQLSSYFESFLNTIINGCMVYSGEILLKCSVEEKMDLIFMHYQKDWSSVKGQNPWAIYKKTTKVRNEMIHYKKTHIGYGTGIPNFKLGGQWVADFFTKESMETLRDGYVQLTKLITTTLGLSIFEKINIFECDGKDALVNYVYDSNKVCVDEFNKVLARKENGQYSILNEKGEKILDIEEEASDVRIFEEDLIRVEFNQENFKWINSKGQVLP